MLKANRSKSGPAFGQPDISLRPGRTHPYQKNFSSIASEPRGLRAPLPVAWRIPYTWVNHDRFNAEAVYQGPGTLDQSCSGVRWSLGLCVAVVLPICWRGGRPFH